MMHYSTGTDCQKCSKTVTFYVKVTDKARDLFPMHPDVRESITNFPAEWKDKELCNECASELGI